MTDFGVLTHCNRALIALIHSVVFLGVATHNFLSPKRGILRGSGVLGDFILIGIYLVSLPFSSGSCATFGLLRTLFGDATIPAAQYMRVILLTCAVAVGTTILLSFSRPAPESAATE